MYQILWQSSKRIYGLRSSSSVLFLYKFLRSLALSSYSRFEETRVPYAAMVKAAARSRACLATLMFPTTFIEENVLDSQIMKEEGIECESSSIIHGEVKVLQSSSSLVNGTALSFQPDLAMLLYRWYCLSIGKDKAN